MLKDCPENKKEKLNENFKKEKFKKKHAFSVTWDDSEDSSSSDSDSDSDTEHANVCFMATDNDVSDLSFEDLIEINSEILDKLKSIKRKHKDTLAKLNRSELEVDMLKDEKKILEEELVTIQESYSNTNSQLLMLSKEIETQKEKNDILLLENHNLKSTIKIQDLDNSSLKTKLEHLTKNVSNFNKGRENLSKILENSKTISNKKGLGYDKTSNTIIK